MWSVSEQLPVVPNVLQNRLHHHHVSPFGCLPEGRTQLQNPILTVSGGDHTLAIYVVVAISHPSGWTQAAILKPGEEDVVVEQLKDDC